MDNLPPFTVPGDFRRWLGSLPVVPHPWRHVTGAAGNSRLAGLLRRAVVRQLYDHLARTYPAAEWTTMNYGCAVLPGESHALCADPGAPEFLAFQLYRRLAVPLGPVDEALEVGSGRGGGAVHLARSFAFRRFVAMDFSAAATALARRRHAGESAVEFVQGDAENLPFAEASFDAVFNVESAHCYGSVERFLAEAHRVLRPGGTLAFADFVSTQGGAHTRLRATLARGPLRVVRVEDITANVVAALAQDEARKRALLDRWVSGWFRTFAWGAYAMEGSAMRRELAAGRVVYLAAWLEKVPGRSRTSSAE